jgi:hypothetical protein
MAEVGIAARQAVMRKSRMRRRDREMAQGSARF